MQLVVNDYTLHGHRIATLRGDNEFKGAQFDSIKRAHPSLIYQLSCPREGSRQNGYIECTIRTIDARARANLYAAHENWDRKRWTYLYSFTVETTNMTTPTRDLKQTSWERFCGTPVDFKRYVFLPFATRVEAIMVKQDLYKLDRRTFTGYYLGPATRHEQVIRIWDITTERVVERRSFWTTSTPLDTGPVVLSDPDAVHTPMAVSPDLPSPTTILPGLDPTSLPAPHVHSKREQARAKKRARAEEKRVQREQQQKRENEKKAANREEDRIRKEATKREAALRRTERQEELKRLHEEELHAAERERSLSRAAANRQRAEELSQLAQANKARRKTVAERVVTGNESRRKRKLEVEPPAPPTSLPTHTTKSGRRYRSATELLGLAAPFL